jgi:hypothetical protein
MRRYRDSGRFDLILFESRPRGAGSAHSPLNRGAAYRRCWCMWRGRSRIAINAMHGDFTGKRTWPSTAAITTASLGLIRTGSFD